MAISPEQAEEVKTAARRSACLLIGGLVGYLILPEPTVPKPTPSTSEIKPQATAAPAIKKATIPIPPSIMNDLNQIITPGLLDWRREKRRGGFDVNLYHLGKYGNLEYAVGNVVDEEGINLREKPDEKKGPIIRGLEGRYGHVNTWGYEIHLKNQTINRWESWAILPFENSSFLRFVYAAREFKDKGKHKVFMEAFQPEPGLVPIPW